MNQNMHILALQKKIPVGSMTFFNKYRSISFDASSSAHCIAQYSKYISVGLFFNISSILVMFFLSPPVSSWTAVTMHPLRKKRMENGEKNAQYTIDVKGMKIEMN